MSWHRWGLVLGGVALWCGCSRNCYQVDLEPRGDSVHRQLTCWHEVEADNQRTSPLPTEELARIQALYPQEAETDKGGKSVFRGVFAHQTPADVGGAGFYSRFATPLGSTAAYVERFRGNDNLDETLAQRRAAADRLCDLLLGWLQSELGNRPNFTQLKRFLNESFRQDLRNLSLYCWSAEVPGTAPRDWSPEFVVRIGQYLCERGYLSPADMPRLATAVASDDPTWIWRHLQQLVAAKLRAAVTDPMPDYLAFLGSQAKAQASLLQYVRTTDIFKKRVARFKEEKPTRGAGGEPKPEDILGELVVEGLLPPSLQSGHDMLTVTLRCPRQPFESNGSWDAATGRVRWQARLQQQNALPVVCYAFWSEPDEAAQRKHFGAVVLADERLAQFALWYRSLTPELAGQWDRFVAQCRPGEGLRQQVEDFRFQNDQKAPASAKEPAAATALRRAVPSRIVPAAGPITSQGAAQVARTLILDGLKSAPKP